MTLEFLNLRTPTNTSFFAYTRQQGRPEPPLRRKKNTLEYINLNCDFTGDFSYIKSDINKSKESNRIISIKVDSLDLNEIIYQNSPRQNTDNLSVASRQVTSTLGGTSTLGSTNTSEPIVESPMNTSEDLPVESPKNTSEDLPVECSSEISTEISPEVVLTTTEDTSPEDSTNETPSILDDIAKSLEDNKTKDSDSQFNVKTAVKLIDENKLERFREAFKQTYEQDDSS